MAASCAATRSPRAARAVRSLSRPHCHRGSDCGCNCLNRPTVLALRNDSEAIRLRVLPGRAKALRIKFPRTTVLVAGFCERLTGHLAVRRKVEAVKGWPLKKVAWI